MEIIALSRYLGREVRKRRNSLMMTQAQLAQTAGVSERLVRSLEMGAARGIGLDKLTAILSQLGLELTLASDTVGSSGAPGEPVSQGAEYEALLDQAIASWRRPAQPEHSKGAATSGKVHA